MDVVTVVDSRDVPHADAGPTQFINCSDDTAILDASLSSAGDEYLYTWNGPGIQNVHEVQIEVELPGWYRLDVMNMETGCEATDSAEVQMTDFLSGADIQSIDPRCLGDASGQIVVSAPNGGVPPFMYSMDGILFQSSPTFNGLVAGTYSIVIRDNVNCEWDTTIIVNEGIELTLDIGPDLELDFGDMAELSATVLPPGVVDSIVWTAIAYAGTCVAEDELLVIVDTEFNIFVPNIFSPNLDNINDFVTAFADEEVVEIVDFEIFDRWGEKVFKKQHFPLNQPQLGWDGRFKGEPMNPGVFVYKLTVLLIDGKACLPQTRQLK
jgi:gliding motility-associated-like protein